MSQGQLAFDVEGMLHEAAVEAALEWTRQPVTCRCARIRERENETSEI